MWISPIFGDGAFLQLHFEVRRRRRRPLQVGLADAVPAEQSPVVGCVNLLPPRAVLLEQERCIVRPIAPGALIRYTALAGGRLVAKNAGVVSVEDDDDI